jgi:hypothetical protein
MKGLTMKTFPRVILFALIMLIAPGAFFLSMCTVRWLRPFVTLSETDPIPLCVLALTYAIAVTGMLAGYAVLRRLNSRSEILATKSLVKLVLGVFLIGLGVGWLGATFPELLYVLIGTRPVP